MNFIETSWVHTYSLILKAVATNNNQVLHVITITKRDTRRYSNYRNLNGAFFRFFFKFWTRKFSFSADPVILDLKLQLFFIIFDFIYLDHKKKNFFCLTTRPDVAYVFKDFVKINTIIGYLIEFN